MVKFRVEQSGEKDFGACDCCGQTSRRVWGLAFSDDECRAAYYVDWTLGRVLDHGAHFDLILGAWGHDAGAEHRSAISVAYRLFDAGPSLMVTDAADREISKSSLVGQAMRREDIVGQPIAAEVFAIVEAILDGDGRVAELLGQQAESQR